MDRDSISRIEEWDSRSVAGGYVGLTELADAGFTGAVESGGTRLLMLNGRVVGVFDGTISAFGNGEATAYEAPDPSLPLLFAMRELDGEVRGRYYTDDTPIGEVDETLSSGGFTGYLELSENVLSGDYYVVYYGGRSLSAAFVGNEGRVVTGDEAMKLAADEVGIYEVHSVDIEVQDVPEPSEDAAAAAVSRPPAESEDEAGAEGATGEAAEEPAGASGEEEVPAEPPGTSTTDSDGATSDEPAATEDDPESPDEDEPSAAEDADRGTDPDVDPAPVVEEAEADGPASDEPEPVTSTSSSSTHSQTSPSRERSESSEPDARFEEEARWREARTVPALDPEESERVVKQRSPDAPREQHVAEEPREAGGADVEAYQQRIGRLEAELEASERERTELADRLEAAVSEREELEAERTALEERIESLEERIEVAEDAAAASADAGSTGAVSAGSTRGESVDPGTALDQTDLFVRYGSKGKPTLATAHDGQASAQEVAENLRIESHSRFDAATTTVSGHPFESFLSGTIQYRFVCWLIEEFLYEIRETGTVAGLRDLYDVLPKIDRAEFDGTVVSRDEEGEERRESFDVICRDRMGKPLVVANLNDSLDPATGDMMARLVEDATAAAEAHESMGAAFLVTASFFEPDALETAADATRGGGFLSRDSKKSFVKLARNGGYHLCLVEARGDDFHVAVPEF